MYFHMVITVQLLITGYEAEVRWKQQHMMEKLSLPQNVSYGIVRSYLLHYGYEDTLNVFDVATSNSVPPISISQQNELIEQDNMYALNQRKTLRQLIRMGQIDAALDKLRDWYPQTIQVSCLGFSLAKKKGPTLVHQALPVTRG
ncbi:Ran-binding protein M-like protein [Bienertia sinuspersici]